MGISVKCDTSSAKNIVKTVERVRLEGGVKEMSCANDMVFWSTEMLNGYLIYSIVLSTLAWLQGFHTHTHIQHTQKQISIDRKSVV